MSNFVHLHNHSHYSLLDGACKIDELVQRAIDYKMPAIALTDHGNMFGAIEFYSTAIKKGIKPIIGVEAYIAPRSRKEKQKSNKKDNSYHLILLAKNLDGFRNLMKLVTIGYLEGFYYKPRIDLEVLEQYHNGIIALSSCIHGEIPHLIIKGDLENARKKAELYLSIFSEDFYLEVQDHNIPEEKIAAEGLQFISEVLSIPIVATNDIHYLDQEHYLAHDILLCIQTSKDYDDPTRLKYSTESLYFKSEEEMKSLFPNQLDRITRTVEVADKCNLEFDFKKVYLPKFKSPKMQQVENLEKYLEEIAWSGLRERYSEITPEIMERLNHELQVINQMGFASYFLIVKDFIDYARSKDIPVGPGRGSAAGSLVSYALGITNIDPLKYNLIFERFLNPDRVSLPDIDIDFCFERRGEVIDYVKKKYGEQNVSQIITFGTMGARAVIRDVGRVLKMKYSEVDKIAKLIPFGKNIENSYNDVKEFREIFNNSDERYQKLIQYSKVLEGLARHASTHAAGVVIAPEELTNYVPLYVSNTGDITTQFDKKWIEKIGLLKIDFLGLRTLTVIKNTLQILKQRDIQINLDKIPLNDKKTFDLFGRGETIGIFQFESGGMREYLKKLKPQRIEDLIAMNALYRPGPIKMIDDFIARKRDEKKIKYLHPDLELILKETYGVIVYQEQVMQIASKLAGFSLSEADELRKAMGSKDASIMEVLRSKFINGVKAKSIAEDVATKIYDLMFEFARYGFNKAHSTGYSIVAYQTGFLKTHYPAEFMAASLSSEMGDSERIMVLLDECKRLGIELLPPDVNQSYADFTTKDNSIRFGLGAIKNIGKGAIESIIQAREKHGNFRNIFDLVRYVDLRVVNRKVLESLTQAGALDSLEGHRAQLYEGIEMAINYAQTIQSEAERGQMNIFDLSEHNKNSVLATRYPYLADVERWDDLKKFALEKELLGFYVTGHPLSGYRDEIYAFSTNKLSNLKSIRDGSAIKVGGIITSVKTIFDQSNRKMAFFNLEDFSGSAENIAFASVFEKYSSLIKKDSLVFIVGQVSIQEEKEPKILCEEIIPLAEAKEKFARTVCMNFNLHDIQINTLSEIKKIVQKNQGNCQILIHLTNGDEREFIIRSKSYFVTPSHQLLTSIRNLIGSENVWIEG